MISLEVRGAQELLTVLRSAPRDVQREMRRGVARALGEVRREARARAPVFQGVLRRRISVRTDPGTIGGRVRPTAPHAHLVEHGRGPGRIPPRSDPRLVAYADRLGVDPYVLARAIGRHGTRPHPWWEPAVHAATPRVEAILREALERVIRWISGR